MAQIVLKHTKSAIVIAHYIIKNMQKEVKVGLMIGGLLLLSGVTYAAVKYKRQTGKFDLQGFLASLPKKKATVIADDPIKQTEQQFLDDREYSYDPTDWMPEK